MNTLPNHRMLNEWSWIYRCMIGTVFPSWKVQDKNVISLALMRCITVVQPVENCSLDILQSSIRSSLGWSYCRLFMCGGTIAIRLRLTRSSWYFLSDDLKFQANGWRRARWYEASSWGRMSASLCGGMWSFNQLSRFPPYTPTCMIVSFILNLISHRR